MTNCHALPGPQFAGPICSFQALNNNSALLNLRPKLQIAAYSRPFGIVPILWDHHHEHPGQNMRVARNLGATAVESCIENHRNISAVADLAANLV